MSSILGDGVRGSTCGGCLSKAHATAGSSNSQVVASACGNYAVMKLAEGKEKMEKELR